MTFSMRVGVMVGLAAGHCFQRDDAAFQLAAIHMLELDGGMADVEVLFEQMVEPD